MPPPDGSLLSHRVVEVPRLDTEPERFTAAGRVRMLPVAATVHSGGRPVACCWIRAQPGGRVAVLVGGVPAGQATAETPAPVSFPAGARGLPLRPEQAARAVGRLACWKPADLAVDALDVDGRAGGPTLEDLFALLPDLPMAVLVVGRPVGADAVTKRLEALSDTIDELAARREGRGAERMRLSRAEAELSYLERWSAQGKP